MSTRPHRASEIRAIKIETRPVPYPADTKAKGWRFELDYERIAQSATWAFAKPPVRPWLLMLWFTAWRQVPCGSLPNDDALIGALTGMPPGLFAKHRKVLMRGWWLGSDGRMYHDVIVERVREMLGCREKTAARRTVYAQKFHAVRARDGAACVYCAATTYLSLDHLIAPSRGGTGEDSNLVTACRSCNAVKGAHTPDEAGMTFVNKAAEALWVALRSEREDTGLRNACVTRVEREYDATGTGTGTKNTEPTASPPVPRGLPPLDPPIDAGASQVTDDADAPPADPPGERLTPRKPPRRTGPEPNGQAGPRRSPECPQQALLALYRERLPMLRQPAGWDGARAATMRRRWRECSRPSSFGDGYATEAEGLAFWAQFMDFVARCPRLRDGITSRDNGRERTWTPSLDWLLEKGNFLKVIEGHFA